MEPWEAEMLREAWGGRPCDHPDFVPETYLASETGDLVCTNCGEIFQQRAVAEILARRRER